MGRAPAPPGETIVRYSEIRKSIRDGDILLFRGNYLISKLFRKVDKSYYSHAALVAWWDDRLMVLQAEGAGIQAVPMSVAVDIYPGKVDWYKLRHEDFSDPQEKLAHVLTEAKSDLGLAYGYVDLLRNIWRWITKVKLRDPMKPHAMFCSEYVERSYRVGGMPLTDRPDVTTMPKHIAASKHLDYQQTIHRRSKSKS